MNKCHYNEKLNVKKNVMCWILGNFSVRNVFNTVFLSCWSILNLYSSSCVQVSLRKQEIADRLNAWNIFNDKNKELCDWLTQMEKKVAHRSENLSIEEMVEKLKKVEFVFLYCYDFVFSSLKGKFIQKCQFPLSVLFYNHTTCSTAITILKKSLMPTKAVFIWSKIQ